MLRAGEGGPSLQFGGPEQAGSWAFTPGWGWGSYVAPSSASSPVPTTLAWLSAQILPSRTPAPFPKHRVSPARPRSLWAPASLGPGFLVTQVAMRTSADPSPGVQRRKTETCPHQAPAPSLSPELRLASSHTFWGLGVFCPLRSQCDPFSSLRAPGLGSLLDAWLVGVPSPARESRSPGLAPPPTLPQPLWQWGPRGAPAPGSLILVSGRDATPICCQHLPGAMRWPHPV